MGSWIYPIHNVHDLQKHLDELSKKHLENDIDIIIISSSYMGQ